MAHTPSKTKAETWEQGDDGVSVDNCSEEEVGWKIFHVNSISCARELSTFTQLQAQEDLDIDRLHEAEAAFARCLTMAWCPEVRRYRGLKPEDLLSLPQATNCLHRITKLTAKARRHQAHANLLYERFRGMWRVVQNGQQEKGEDAAEEMLRRIDGGLKGKTLREGRVPESVEERVEVVNALCSAEKEALYHTVALNGKDEYRAFIPTLRFFYCTAATGCAEKVRECVQRRLEEGQVEDARSAFMTCLADDQETIRCANQVSEAVGDVGPDSDEAYLAELDSTYSQRVNMRAYMDTSLARRVRTPDLVMQHVQALQGEQCHAEKVFLDRCLLRVKSLQGNSEECHLAETRHRMCLQAHLCGREFAQCFAQEDQPSLVACADKPRVQECVTHLNVELNRQASSAEEKAVDKTKRRL